MRVRFNRSGRAAVTMLLVLFLLTLAPPVTHAFPVPELPEDNLIVNPWFRSASNRTAPGFNGWTLVYTDGISWGPSQKESNPSPDVVVSGVCGFKEVYCGTAARWAEQVGVLYPNIDVVMYQIVAADPSQRQLRFFSYYVSHRVELGAINIYGSNTSDGPWTLLWVPLSHSQAEQVFPESGEVRDLWEETGYLERSLVEGYPYYKIEVQARLPELPGGRIRGAGFKVTGVYFATSQTDEPGILPATAIPPATATTDDAREAGTEAPAEMTTAETGSVAESPSVPPAVEPDSVAESTSVPPAAEAAPAPTRTAASVAVAATEPARRGVTNLTAEALSATEISLDWPEEENSGRGYRLERSLSETTGWEFVSRIRPGDSSFIDSGLSPDTLYYYRLRVTQNSTSSVVSARTEPSPTSTLSATTKSSDTVAANAPVPTEVTQAVDPAPGGTRTAFTSASLVPAPTVPSVASQGRDWRGSSAVIVGTLLVGAGVMVARRRKK